MRFAPFALAFLFACASYPVPQAPSAPSLAANMKALTVALTQDGRTFCSGTWVAPTKILTAEHCVHDEATVTFRTPDSPDEGLAAVAYADATHDLALLTTILGAGAHAYAVRGGLPAAGDTVAAMGHPLGVLEWSYTEGQVSAVRSVESMSDVLSEKWDDCKECELIQATTPITPGNSGGGLFNSDGELVGVCVFTLFDPFTPMQNLNFFVPVAYAKLVSL